MPLSPDDFSELVVQTVETALGPILQRLASAEAKLTMLGDVRDRVVAVETKSAAAPTALTALDLEVVRQACIADVQTRLAPVAEAMTAARERVAALEAKQSAVTPADLVMARDQAVETVRRWADGEFAILREKVAAPVSVEIDVPQEVATAIAPTLQRCAAIEARVGALESKSEPASVDALMTAMANGLTSIKASVDSLERTGDDHGALDDLKARVAAVEATTTDLRDRVSGLVGRIDVLPASKDYADLLSRVAVAETFSRQPGPQGPAGPAGPHGKDGVDGKDGRDGVNGKDGSDGLDGKDGLGFDDMGAELDGDRTLVLKFARGAVSKTFPILLPFQSYQGVFVEGKQYTKGDVVTWGGSQWYCKEDTSTKPGDGSRVWVLCVKKGRDGRDGKDAPGALPVVSVGRQA